MVRAWISTVAALGLLAAALGAHAAQPPNIVYIVSDDQGWKDVGFHGSTIETPAIDRLAEGGAQLQQFYAQPMCTPTRAALLTGRYPYRYGLQSLVIPSAGTYGLPNDERLLPQALREAGYRTAIVGKWHLGHADRNFWPNARGFDYQYGAVLGEIDYFTHEAHGFVDWFRNGEQLVEPGYVTDLIGRDAVRLIESHDTTKPLFLYLTFTAPHAPYQAPEEYLQRYASIEDPNRRAYAAMITAMDDQIGKVVAALDARGMRDNTLVVFQSDNGGPRSAMFTGEVDTSGGTIPADNGPWRDGKASYYEGGTRVIALANWPGHIAPGSVVDSPIHVVDMFPTLAKLAGTSPGSDKQLDGMDVWPTIASGAPSPRSEVIYGIEPHQAAIRQGRWKLVWQTLLPSRVELYDLDADPGETRNVAASHPEIVAGLQARIEAEAGTAAQPLIFVHGLDALKQWMFGKVATPADLATPGH
jgi:arylsulfatase A-like enzyme